MSTLVDQALRPLAATSSQNPMPHTVRLPFFAATSAGRIRIEGETREVMAGDAIAIPPDQKHKLWNTGNKVLRLLCCCAPAYEHNDIIIMELF